MEVERNIKDESNTQPENFLSYMFRELIQWLKDFLLSLIAFFGVILVMVVLDVKFRVFTNLPGILGVLLIPAWVFWAAVFFGQHLANKIQVLPRYTHLWLFLTYYVLLGLASSLIGANELEVERVSFGITTLALFLVFSSWSVLPYINYGKSKGLRKHSRIGLTIIIVSIIEMVDYAIVTPVIPDIREYSFLKKFCVRASFILIGSLFLLDLESFKREKQKCSSPP